MGTSSLIFLVIVGIWVAYLMPQLMRRRETLAQSRSQDRWSAASRLIEPAAAPPRPEGGHRSHAADLLTARAPRPVPAASAADDRLPAASAADDRLPAASAADRLPAASAADRLPPASAADRLAPSGSGARRRRRTLLALTLLAGAGWAARAAGLLDVGVAAALTAPLGLDVLLVLLTARSRRAARRGSGRRSAPRVTGRVSSAPGAPTRAEAGPRSAATGVPAPGRGRDVVDLRESAPEDAPASGPAEPQAGGPQAGADPTGGPQAGPAEDGTWTPVPVPPPMYTMKPVVPRAATIAWLDERDEAAVEVVDVRVAEPLEETIDLDAVLERRRAAGA